MHLYTCHIFILLLLGFYSFRDLAIGKPRFSWKIVLGFFCFLRKSPGGSIFKCAHFINFASFSFWRSSQSQNRGLKFHNRALGTPGIWEFSESFQIFETVSFVLSICQPTVSQRFVRIEFPFQSIWTVSLAIRDCMR